MFTFIAKLFSALTRGANSLDLLGQAAEAHATKYRNDTIASLNATDQALITKD